MFSLFQKHSVFILHTTNGKWSNMENIKKKKHCNEVFFSWAVKTGDNEIFRKRFKNVLVTFH